MTRLILRLFPLWLLWRSYGLNNGRFRVLLCIFNRDELSGPSVATDLASRLLSDPKNLIFFSAFSWSHNYPL